MSTTALFAEIASLAGDPARAAMLVALTDGRALTAGELARAAGVAPQTASGHLHRLTCAGLVAMERQGRHRYHRLASQQVAQMLESIMRVASDAALPRKPVSTGPRDTALRAARTCYDHLAGQLGVSLADGLVRGGHIELSHDSAAVTDDGEKLFRDLGLNLAPPRRTRLLCRPCLDWSERRPHLAGRLGAALCAHCFADGWVRRIEGTRALTITPRGRRQFRSVFGLSL
jgi:DNA-binding transcriptional ArsR family regulator